MVENDDQTQQPPERSTPRHSAPQRQQPRQFPQRPQEALPQPPDPAADPLLGQSRAPAPPPPRSQQNAFHPAQQPMQPRPQQGLPGHPPMNQRPIGQPPMGQPPKGQQQNPHAGNGPQAPVNSNQNPPGPNQDLYRPIQLGPGQNNPGQQPPYGQRPSQQGQPQQNNPQQSNPQPGQPPAQHSQPPSQYGQPVAQHGPPLQQGQPPSQYGPPQQQHQMSQHGQPPYWQPQYGQSQYGEPPQGGAPLQASKGPRLSAGQESPGQYGSHDPGTFGTPRRTGDRAPRLVGALALLVVAVITTVWCVSWVWNKADATTPVALPSANGTPLKTVNPSVKPSATPPPTGKVVGSNIIASNNDTMPILSSAWSDNNGENSGLYGGASTWLTVHKNYDGNSTWGNYVAFGGLNKTIPFTNTPAGLRAATGQAASIAIVRLYDKNVKLIGKATHRTISVKGHPGHEVTVKVAVSKPKLKETYSTVAVAVIDRGDGTGMVAVGDFAGSTQQWLPIWRAKVQQITFAR